MTVKVGINGFGRVGRQVIKAIGDYHAGQLEVVAFNDIGNLLNMIAGRAGHESRPGGLGQFDHIKAVIDVGKRCVVALMPMPESGENCPPVIPYILLFITMAVISIFLRAAWIK